jgi:DNA (cytosine-5)-methyltransferase 1
MYRENVHLQEEYKLISLFTGAGGMDIGIEKTGRFQTLACIELEKPICDTLRTNRDAGRFGNKNTHIIEGDIATIDPNYIMDICKIAPGELDVLIGGPPCQTFSTAGRRGTIQDPRGLQLWQFLRFVEALRPKFFIMENVRGLLSAALKHRPLKSRPNQGGVPLEPEELPGSAVNLWIEDLAKISNGAYRVDCFEVNAVNYGAHQLRERVLFFGNRLGHVVDFPQPTHGNVFKKQQAQKTLFDIDNEQETLFPFATLGDALSTIIEDDGEIMDFSPRKKQYLAMVPEGGNWRTLPEEIQKESMGKAWYAKGGRSGWWRRLSRDLPSPTIVTMPNHSGTAMCHPTETRALTVKECAAIQQFPPDWQFCGTTSEKYKQIGNALPIRLGEIAGNVVIKHLNHVDDATFIPVTTPPHYRRIYISSHVRTRQWYKDGTAYTWVDGEENIDAQYSAKKSGKLAMGRRTLPTDSREQDVDCDEVYSECV